MRRYLLTAAGPDRPGIVAGVTKALYELGCNLDDSAMTQLRGEFAILLMFTAPPQTSFETVKKRLLVLGQKLKLSVQIKPLSVRETKAAAAPAAMCLVTLYGADRPGIVYRVAETLARHRVNITDVTTHRTDASRAAKAGYILYLEGELPRAGFAKLEADLQTLGRQLGVTVSLKPQEPTAL